MRQAGRYMSEYRPSVSAIPARDLPHADLATAVTLQPFAGSTSTPRSSFPTSSLPLEPMGIPFDFSKAKVRQSTAACGRRPTSGGHAVRTARALAPVLDAIRQIQRVLAGRVPLIGFAGAPFTLASYAIEGGDSTLRAHQGADVRHPARGTRSRSARRLIATIEAQIEAGVDAVQLFDSWVGQLNAHDYRDFVLPHTKRIFDRIAPLGVPTIHFGVGTGAILGDCAKPAAT